MDAAEKAAALTSDRRWCEVARPVRVRTAGSFMLRSGNATPNDARALDTVRVRTLNSWGDFESECAQGDAVCVFALLCALLSFCRMVILSNGALLLLLAHTQMVQWHTRSDKRHISARASMTM